MPFVFSESCTKLSTDFVEDCITANYTAKILALDFALCDNSTNWTKASKWELDGRPDHTFRIVFPTMANVVQLPVRNWR